VIKFIVKYNSGGKDAAINNWQRIVIDIPEDKLILSVKEARPSYMPTRIQALVIIRQRLNGIRYMEYFRIFLFLFSCEFDYTWSLSISALCSSKNRKFGYMGCNIRTCNTCSTSWLTSGFD
jgi:hypothetical protein